MNFIRMTAFIAVTMTAYACNEKNKLQDIQAINLPADEKGLVDANNKVEEETKTADKGFYTDTVIRPQTSNEKQKQQHQQQLPAIKPDWDKKIIKTASLHLEVKDYNTFYSSIREKVKAAGG